MDWENLYKMDDYSAKFDANEITDKIWQGAVPPDGPSLKYFGFDVLVLAANNYQPEDSNFPGVKVLRAKLVDWDPPEDGTFEKAEEVAKLAAKEVNEGKKVLITCHAGLNRSGLITALTLRLTTGMSGKDCVSFVQHKRAYALCNDAFANYVSILLSRATEELNMDNSKPFARTFFDNNTLDVEILSPPTVTGLCKVRYGEKVFVRNVVQLNPINEEAKKLLGGVAK